MYGLFQKLQSKEPIFSEKKTRAAQNTNAHALPKASITPKKKPSAPKSQPPHIHPQNHQSHSVPFHTACSIASRSTQHRLTLHGASAHAPRCINPPYSKSLFPPRVEGPSRPYSPSCPVCCDSIATCPRFSSTSRLLPVLPVPSRSVRLFPVLLPACFLSFPVRSSAFPSRLLRFHRNLPALSARFPPAARSSRSSRLFPPASRSALSSSSCPLPGLEGIQKKPSGIALGGLLTKNGGYLLSHGCAVPSARAGLTSLFGMGRGGTPPP